MNQRERNALDRYITGNWGEDQFRDELTDEQVEAILKHFPVLLEAAEQSLRVWPDHLRCSVFSEAVEKAKRILDCPR